jgi:hypothetical protein
VRGTRYTEILDLQIRNGGQIKSELGATGRDLKEPCNGFNEQRKI